MSNHFLEDIYPPYHRGDVSLRRFTHYGFYAIGIQCNQPREVLEGLKLLTDN
jgi:hypothetical protein